MAAAESVADESASTTRVNEPQRTLSRPSTARLAVSWRQRPVPFHPLFFAAYPVLFLFSQNLGEVGLGEVVPPLLVSVGLAAAALILGALALRDGRRVAIVLSALIVAIFAYGHIADALVQFPFVRGWMLQLAAIALVGGAALLGWRLRARLVPVTRGLNIFAGLLVVTSLVLIVPYEMRALSAPRENARPGAITSQSATQRDIYYLIFDRYGSARSLALLYGLDDTPFQDALRSLGFSVVTRSHANYVKTSLSLAATLNVDYLDGLAARMGADNSDEQPVYAMLPDHAVGRFLKAQGYRYIHIGSYYAPTKTSSIADLNLRPDQPSDFVATLYDTTIFPALTRRLGLTATATLRQRAYDAGRFQLDALDRMPNEPGPKFVFAHLLLPHDPYVFDVHGALVSDEANERRSNKEGFAAQLAYLQSRLRPLLTRLLSGPPDRRPIVILQADEGPYPRRYAADTVNFDWSTATSDELEIKFGILNAMELPGSAGELPSTLSSVNTFRLVLNRYFGADLPLLPDRSWTSAAKYRPYDLTEITARLSSLR